MDDLQFLSVAEAAKRIGMSDRFVYDQIAKRKITYVEFGSTKKIRPADLARYIAENTIEAGEIVKPTQKVSADIMREARRHFKSL